MGVYLITYDLEDATKENALLKYIKGRSSWVLVSESSYAVSTSADVSVVRDKIKSVTGDRVTVLVITIRKSWAAYGLPNGVTDWLKTHL